MRFYFGKYCVTYFSQTNILVWCLVFSLVFILMSFLATSSEGGSKLPRAGWMFKDFKAWTVPER